jgi:4-hydroxyphenylpyruvate dioxygenase
LTSAPKTVAQLHELGLLYDREAGGEFVHFYTAAVGEVFFEVVQRPGGYDGHGPGTRPSGWRRSAQTWARLYA